jgi:hypothetical protein
MELQDDLPFISLMVPLISDTCHITPERFRTVLNAFLTLFELQNVRSVPKSKNHSGVLFSTPTPTIKIVFFWGLEFGV